jgi:two-component system cell cycle response regulator
MDGLPSMTIREDTLLPEDPAQTTEAVGRVLIADDDDDFRLVLARRAMRMGLEVVEARDGAEAIEALRGQNFDALVLDLYMPKATGLEVVKQARGLDPFLQAIVLTGSASLETAVEALRSGVYDYLTKPLESLTTFELSLTRLLERHHLLKENARLFNEVQRLAVTDPLTGLYNRRKLDETLETEVERSNRYRRPLSAIMVDLDRMKQINDRLGHPAGDQALQEAAQAIRSQVRRVDVVTRYGGDEFFVLLPESEFREALGIAKRIREHVGRIVIQGQQLTASAGVIQWKPEYNTGEAFFKAVDGLLYRAKGKGGGRIFAMEPASGDVFEVE